MIAITEENKPAKSPNKAMKKRKVLITFYSPLVHMKKTIHVVKTAWRTRHDNSNAANHAPLKSFSHFAS